MLGTQSAAAASAVAPHLRAGLVAAGLPAADSGRVLDQFGVCLHDRLVAADPTVLPASCRPTGPAAALPPGVHREVASAGGAAVRIDFARSVVRTLWFQVGVFGLSGLLMLPWPAAVGRRRPETIGEADTAGRVREGPGPVRPAHHGSQHGLDRAG